MALKRAMPRPVRKAKGAKVEEKGVPKEVKELDDGSRSVEEGGTPRGARPSRTVTMVRLEDLKVKAE